MSADAPGPIIVWDLAVRVCHGGLALSIATALWLGYRSDPEGPAFLHHMLAGLIALWFLALRILLACVGSRTARWRALLHGPVAIGRYFSDVLRWRPSRHGGLNPATMLFAAALHTVLVALVLTGFDATWAESWHGRLALAFLALIACHLTGLVLHTLRHRDFSALAMIHGLGAGPPAAGLWGHGWKGGVVAALASALVVWMALRGLSTASAELRLPGCPVITLPFIQKG